MPRIVKPTPAAIAQAADALRAGTLVAFATETVYGLGADTFNKRALQRVYELKGRPLDNPTIAHVLDSGQASTVATWDARCDALASRFWPGPLTLVLPRLTSVPENATAGYPTIAVRSPSHPVARALLSEFGGAISAPSANRSGHISPTTAQHVADDFADAADLLILDGGPCAVGIESTVLDLSTDKPRILRPGSVSAADISAVIGQIILTQNAKHQQASPGTAASHYAPRTPSELVNRAELAGRLASMGDPVVVLALGSLDVSAPHRTIPMPTDAISYAATLYSALRRADAMQSSRIIIETPHEPGELWDAIRNRLQRSAG